MCMEFAEMFPEEEIAEEFPAIASDITPITKEVPVEPLITFPEDSRKELPDPVRHESCEPESPEKPVPPTIPEPVSSPDDSPIECPAESLESHEIGLSRR